MAQAQKAPAVTAQNIETVIRLEEENESRRTRSERLTAWIGSFAGTISFVLLQLLAVAIWIGVNSRLGSILPFDPYPFSLLSTTLSLEGVLLMSFILVRQSNMSERADRRSHLALQINLLTEQEVTKILQMLQETNLQLGIKEAVDPETEELSKETAVESLSEELRANLDQDDTQ
jgi:uncharacterized membrane protein